MEEFPESAAGPCKPYIAELLSSSMKSKTEKSSMKNPLMVTVRWLALFSTLVITSIPAFPQMINAGLKGGFNWSWTRADDVDFRKEYNTHPVPGFNAGAVFSFQLKKRYFLHTELLYATKGRMVTGDLGLRDETTYNYVEIPLLYQIHFNGSLGATGQKKFKWYAGIGPNFSYWLGGKGTITHFEITDHDIPEIPYKLRFGERPVDDFGQSEFVYIEDARRIQVGINMGGGVWVEPMNNKKIMIDLRFELGHSWLAGAESADYVFPQKYSKTLEARNLGLRLSAMYLLQTNLDKKVRNKGKSNVSQKGQIIKRKK